MSAFMSQKPHWLAVDHGGVVAMAYCVCDCADILFSSDHGEVTSACILNRDCRLARWLQIQILNHQLDQYACP